MNEFYFILLLTIPIRNLLILSFFQNNLIGNNQISAKYPNYSKEFIDFISFYLNLNRIGPIPIQLDDK